VGPTKNDENWTAHVVEANAVEIVDTHARSLGWLRRRVSFAKPVIAKKAEEKPPD